MKHLVNNLRHQAEWWFKPFSNLSPIPSVSEHMLATYGSAVMPPRATMDNEAEGYLCLLEACYLEKP